MRAHDWMQSPLGPPAQWPDALNRLRGIPEEGIDKNAQFSSKSRRVEFRGESLECQVDQMKTMPRKDRISTLSDVAERA